MLCLLGMCIIAAERNRRSEEASTAVLYLLKHSSLHKKVDFHWQHLIKEHTLCCQLHTNTMKLTEMLSDAKQNRVGVNASEVSAKTWTVAKTGSV